MVEFLNHNFRSVKIHCPTSCVLNILLYWIIGNSHDQEYTTAVFYESLRLFAPVIRLMRTVFSDTILSTRRFTTNIDGSLDNVEMVKTPIKAGSVIVLDINGLHYNRKCYLNVGVIWYECQSPAIHWGEDVDEFKPDRFIDTETYKWPRDACRSFDTLINL